MPTAAYYRRVFSAYVLGGKSHLTFWHETPAENLRASVSELGEYYMCFAEKSNYPGTYDAHGIPLLDYHGHIGLQYNPIAIAQYGLGNFNLWQQTGDPVRRERFFRVADWLTTHLEKNGGGWWVWNHHFDWEYRDTLRSPWYSALAQGQGISVLVRAHKASKDPRYLDAAQNALDVFGQPLEKGGVSFTDQSGRPWYEEYIVSPPTHILNGFIWALWGLYDHFLATRQETGHKLFLGGVQTLLQNLHRYDLGFWSLYEQSGTRLPMVASRFYHQLHVVQLRVMHRLTGESLFAQVAERWDHYARSRRNRARALCCKAVFKLCYY